MRGVGTFSGCPYLSAGLEAVPDMVEQARLLATAGLIDPVEQLAEAAVLVYNGLRDTIVPWQQADRIRQFYAAFLEQPDTITVKDDIDSEHGMVCLDSILHLSISAATAFRLLRRLL